MSKWRIWGAIFMIGALLVMLIPAAEADAESASAFSIKSGELVKYKGSDRTVTVPDTVTSIGKGAFEDNTTVEKIILPDSVKQIRAYAFWGCDNLKTVTLGKGLSTIGDFAFTNCTGLETMTIPSNIHSIGIQSFSECKRLEDITIPPEVVDIREDAFDGDYLLNIHCETGSYADKYAKDFYERQKKMPVYADNTDDSSADTNTIKIPGKVPDDGVYSGADVQGQTENSPVVDETTGQVLGSTTVVANQAVILAQKSRIPVIGDSSGVASAYMNSGLGGSGYVYTGLPSKIQDVSDVVSANGSVSERVHYRDEEYTELVLPDGTKEIGEFAYARSGLRQAVLPDGIEKISYAAFYHCDNLGDVELPDTVGSVEAKAFAHTPWVERFLAGTDGSASDFLISGGVLVAYRGSDKEVKVPEGVRVIAGEAFADHKEIEKISLPDTLQAIDDRAFAGCNILDVDYEGEALSDDFVVESVSMQSLAAASGDTQLSDGSTGGRKVPLYIWCLAAGLFAGGLFCIFKERY